MKNYIIYIAKKANQNLSGFFSAITRNLSNYSARTFNKFADLEIKTGTAYKVAFAIFLLGYFCLNLTCALMGGGNGVLFQHIAMADRFLSGQGFYYSATEASTVYFPGVGFLAILVGKINYEYRDIVLLVIANIIGTLFMFGIVKLGTKFTKSKWIPLFICTLIMALQLPVYQAYMNEFKADSLVLLFGMALMLIIDRLENKCGKGYNAQNWVLIFLIAILMNISKQHALFVDVALGLYIVFQRHINLKYKVYLLSPMLLGGIIAVTITFSIPGSKLQVIDIFRAMAYHTFRESIHILLMSLYANYYVYGLLLAFFIALLFGQFKFGKTEAKWGLVSLLFLLGQIAGTLKSGGNEGNIEAGLVGCLPFACMVAYFLYKRYIAEDKRKEFNAFLLVCVLMLGCHMGLKAYRSIPGIRDAFANNEKISETLTKYAGGEEILYYSNQYMNVKRSSAIPAVDAYTVPSTLDEYKNTLSDIFNSRKYKIIYIPRRYLVSMDNSGLLYYNFKTNMLKAFEDNYVQLSGDDIVTDTEAELYVLK